MFDHLKLKIVKQIKKDNFRKKIFIKEKTLIEITTEHQFFLQ